MNNPSSTAAWRPASLHSAAEAEKHNGTRQFLKLDSTRVTIAEYRYGTSAAMLPLAVVLKCLRAQLPSSSDDPNVEALRPFEVEQLPEEVEEHFRSLVEQLDRLGFVEPICHTIEDTTTHTSRWMATFVHRSDRGVARIHERHWFAQRFPHAQRFIEIITGFSDGTFLCTSSAKPDLHAPPACRVERSIGVEADELWEQH